VELLPREYCDALLSLLDQIPPFHRSDVERIFIEELGAPPQNLFHEFDYTPIASASIGQVHRATLPDGTNVAIKVQRPNIDQVFERDCLLLEGMVRLIVVLRLRGLYFLRESVRDLTVWTADELDYYREAAYCQHLGRNAEGVASEAIPRVFWEYTTSRVLVIEFLEGPSVAQYFRLKDSPYVPANMEVITALEDQGFVPAVFTSNVITNFLRDAFLFGAFHADLHPANLLIRPGNVVGYVDFGIVAFLTPETRRKMVQLILAFASGNIPGMYDCLLEVCTLEEDANLPAVRRKIEEIAPSWYQEPAIPGRIRFRVSATKAFLDLFGTCRQHGVFLDREMVRFIRSLFYVDGLVGRLASSVDLADKLRDAVEMWQTSEARRKVSSAGTVLVLLTDLVLWAQAGPGGLLRSLEEIGRTRHGPVTPGAGSDPAARWRARTVAIGAVWVILALAFTLGNQFPELRKAPFQAILAAGVMLALSAWVIRSLRRIGMD
jgi:ubiquinone biosynthesis protein